MVQKAAGYVKEPKMYLMYNTYIQSNHKVYCVEYCINKNV